MPSGSARATARAKASADRVFCRRESSHQGRDEPGLGRPVATSGADVCSGASIASAVPRFAEREMRPGQADPQSRADGSGLLGGLPIRRTASPGLPAASSISASVTASHRARTGGASPAPISSLIWLVISRAASASPRASRMRDLRDPQREVLHRLRFGPLRGEAVLEGRLRLAENVPLEVRQRQSQVGRDDLECRAPAALLGQVQTAAGEGVRVAQAALLRLHQGEMADRIELGEFRPPTDSATAMPDRRCVSAGAELAQPAQSDARVVQRDRPVLPARSEAAPETRPRAASKRAELASTSAVMSPCSRATVVSSMRATISVGGGGRGPRDPGSVRARATRPGIASYVLTVEGEQRRRQRQPGGGGELVPPAPAPTGP